MKKFLYVLGFFGLFLFLTGCKDDSINRPNNICPITDLLLSQYDYPNGINLGEIISPVAEQPRESADQSGNYQGSLLFQNVIRYKSRAKAAERFNEWKQIAFNDKSLTRGSWEVPPVITTNNFSANKIYVACGNTGTGNVCRMIGQYDEYFVYYFVYIVPNYGVSQEMFLDFLSKLDTRINACVNSSH